LRFFKNNSLLQCFEIKKVFIQRTGIGAPTDNKANIYKNIKRRRKKLGGCQTTKSGKKTKRKLLGFDYAFLFKEEE
jgi:hypothetical protein